MQQDRQQLQIALSGEELLFGAVVSGVVQRASRLGSAYRNGGLTPREMGSYPADAADQAPRNPTAEKPLKGSLPQSLEKARE